MLDLNSTFKYLVLLFVIFNSFIFCAHAQSHLQFKNGQKLAVDSVVLTDTSVYFKRWDHRSGPHYMRMLYEVQGIWSQDGTLLYPWELPYQEGGYFPSDFELGVRYAYKYYNVPAKYPTRSFAAGCFLPCIGIAVPLRYQTCKGSDVEMRSMELLMKDKSEEFKQGFAKSARKIRMRKVWKNFLWANSLTCSTLILLALLLSN